MDEKKTIVAEYELDGKPAGVYVDPPSDVEMTYIQCPPSFAETKINPRPAVMLFTPDAVMVNDGRIAGLKAIAEERKTLIVCPAEFEDGHLLDSIDWLLDNAGKLNVIEGDVGFACTEGAEEAAEAFRAVAAEEYEAEFDPVTKFEVQLGTASEAKDDMAPAVVAAATSEDERNDPSWAHPELRDFWAAGNADVVNMCCDESIPLEKRQKRLSKMIRMSCSMLASQGVDPFGGKDTTDADGFGKLETFTCGGCPEEPEGAEHEVYALIPEKKTRRKRPAIYFVMGGCFFMQEPMLYPQLLRWAKQYDAVVVTPRYSTLLDAQYPAQVNECHAGYQWMIDNAEELGLDPDRVVLFGLSTGAQLALALAFRLKRYGITPRGCVLADPMIEDRFVYESSKIVRDAGDARLARTMFAGYVGEENLGSDEFGPEAFPNRATVEDCAGLCPLFIHVGESDQDRDPVMEFAGKCYAAKVPCSTHVWYGAAHATLWNSSGSSMSERFFDVLHGDIRDCLTYDLRR